MQVKAFHIRLTKEHFQIDQDKINHFMDGVSVINTTSELVSGQNNFWSILIWFDNLKNEGKETSTNKISYTVDTELTNQEREIYETLTKWRFEKATELNVPSFTICHNTELISIVKEKPATIDELYNIKGFAGRKIAKFGDDIIALLNLSLSGIEFKVESLFANEHQ